MSRIEKVLSGSRLALARLITGIENNNQDDLQVLDALFPHTGTAYLLGVTGSPGSGKSTLVNQLAQQFRKSSFNGKQPTVAILAVDPTSPFSGGAVLGDRVRMRDLSGDEGIFIRSMASRGAIGGLSRAAASVVQAMDAAGFDIIIIETVGAGQAEVEIAGLAHTTLVVESPGMGDDIQAIKAGILEIADILVVNKADRPGVDNTVRGLEMMLEMAYPGRLQNGHHLLSEKTKDEEREQNSQVDNAVWRPVVIRTIATDGTGIDDLISQIFAHHEFLHSTGKIKFRDKLRIQRSLEQMIQDELVKNWRKQVPEPVFEKTLIALAKREITPAEALKHLISGM